MNKVEIRLLLARFHEDEGAPVVIAAIDRTVWDHWDDEDENIWTADAIERFGCDPSDYDVRQAWGTFDGETLAIAFMAPIAEGEVTPA